MEWRRDKSCYAKFSIPTADQFMKLITDVKRTLQGFFWYQLIIADLITLYTSYFVIIVFFHSTNLVNFLPKEKMDSLDSRRESLFSLEESSSEAGWLSFEIC